MELGVAAAPGVKVGHSGRHHDSLSRFGFAHLAADPVAGLASKDLEGFGPGRMKWRGSAYWPA
jgi:hypothetical protein